jgi:type IV pilus assembly protein PilB
VQHQILPLAFEENRLVVATTDPTNVFLLDEVKRKTRKNLLVKVCPSGDIKTLLQELNESESGTDYQVDDIIKNMEENDVEVVDVEDEDLADLERSAGESPIIKFVNYIIFTAVKEGASDIHIEPGDKKLRLRYRIDGVLFENMNPPHNMHAPIVSRIKIMANLDIAERRLPQDGRIRVSIHGRNVDMRVSTLPSSHGEKVVIRILDTGSTRRSMTELGFDSNTLDILTHQISQPHGIILVTGPTGSGKSTTLYSALGTMDIRHLNISTVEDPVEFQLDGITQIQVHERIGMTFSAALRSLLRQDPDVIMVGEIRDEETARIAVQASLTGHLVLSTLHTNDAPSSITRLINIGIESYLIAASTNAVLAQRLVRRICSHCKEPYEPKPEEAGYMEMYGFNRNNLFHGSGCDYCRHTGYQGRVGLYELLVIDDKYRDVITNNPNVTELRRMCKERGMVTLRDDGFNKVRQGSTTIDEVMRVTECKI